MRKKRIVFEELDKNHADLIIKLRTRGLTQKTFFQAVVRAFIDDNRSLVSFFEEMTESKSRFGKKVQKRVSDTIQKGRELERNFRLTEEDKVDIFDILESEGVEI